MFPFPGPGMMLMAWMMRKFIRRQRREESTMYYVVDPDEELGYYVTELPTIPKSVVSGDDFLQWIGRR